MVILVLSEKTAGGYQIAAEKGKVYKDFRGEDWVLDGWAAPTHAGSTGRVYVHKPDKDEFDTAREFFPGVLGMEWIHTADAKQGGCCND